MSVSYHSYLYLGVKIKDYLKVTSEEDFYYKFDPKTGQKTNEKVVEKTIYTLTFGDKELKEEVEGTRKLKFYEETYENLLEISYRDEDNLKVYQDYEDPDESVVGFMLSDIGTYSNKLPKSYTLEELQELSEELKIIFKNRFGIDIEPKVYPLFYVSY